MCNFFKNWQLKLKLHNLRMSESPSNKIQLAYFYLSESILKKHFNVKHPVECLKKGAIFWLQRTQYSKSPVSFEAYTTSTDVIIGDFFLIYGLFRKHQLYIK